MSGADVAGLISAINSKDNDNFFGDGIWGIIMLLIVAGIFTGGWGGFGTNNAALTASDLDSRFNARDIFNTNSNVLENKYASALESAGISKDVLENRYASQLCCCNTQKEVLTNRYENALATASLQKDILVGNQVAQNQLSECCCSIKTAIAEDGEKTRALITANYEASLLEKINDLKAQVSNQEQTNTILNTMGRWHSYLPCGNNCSCSYSTNLI